MSQLDLRRERRFGVVSTPVFHASTVLFDTVADLNRAEQEPLNRERMYYGRMGTPTTRALEDALCALDDSVGAVLAPSGVASTAALLQCFLRPGDHLLVADCAYGPTRRFCLGHLAAMGIETTFYPPDCGAGLKDWLRPNTRMIFMESPGSATFEVQDVPAIAALARERGILTAIDNTWATPLLFNPLAHGVDIAMQSGTKYLNGHADCLFGVCTTRDVALHKQLQQYHVATGTHLAPDDCYLARRGLRTLHTRLRAHEAHGLALAQWLAVQPQVVKVLHPAFADCPGHTVFKRDFAGASGLFAVVLEGMNEQRLAAMLDHLQLFGMGYSWGGFESLVLPMQVTRDHPTLKLREDQVLLRFHAGLEAPEALIEDLQQGFVRAFG